MNKLGLDIGFGDVKVVIPLSRGDRVSLRSVKFPTAIGRVKRGIVDLGNKSCKEYVFDGGSYFLGVEALYCQDTFDTRDRDFLVKYSPLLAFKALDHMRAQDRVDLSLCVGIPLGYYKKYKKSVTRVLSKISVNSQTIIPKTIDVRAQGQGVYFDYIFNNSGKLDPAKKYSNILILDIGFNTVDILGIIEGQPSMEWSDMLTKEGISRICEDLKLHVKKEYGVEESDQRMSHALEAGKIAIFGKSHDLSEIIGKLAQSYTERFIQNIRSSKWSDFLSRVDKLVVAGGGAYYVADAFQQVYPKDFVYVPGMPEFSNARGFLKYSLGMI